MRKILITTLLCLIAPLSLAFDGYQIEMIIFSNINKETLSSEQWPLVSKDQVNLASAITPTITGGDNLQMLSPENFTLAKEQLRIKKYSRYKTLLHIAWRESFVQLNKPTTIHLYGGNLYDDNGNVIQATTNESTPYSPEQNWQLNGKVTISLNRYFDMHFNLLLGIPSREVPATALNDQQQPMMYVQLAQSQRLRSKELNYIDHPLYGVLFKITPLNN